MFSENEILATRAIANVRPVLTSMPFARKQEIVLPLCIGLIVRCAYGKSQKSSWFLQYRAEGVERECLEMRCIKQFALNAAKNAKYHSNPTVQDQSTAANVILSAEILGDIKLIS